MSRKDEDQIQDRQQIKNFVTWNRKFHAINIQSYWKQVGWVGWGERNQKNLGRALALEGTLLPEKESGSCDCCKIAASGEFCQHLPLLWKSFIPFLNWDNRWINLVLLKKQMLEEFGLLASCPATDLGDWVYRWTRFTNCLVSFLIYK